MNHATQLQSESRTNYHLLDDKQIFKQTHQIITTKFVNEKIQPFAIHQFLSLFLLKCAIHLIDA